MGIFHKNTQVESMKTICDVLDSVASFTKPEVVHFPELGNVVRFRVLPILYAIVVPFENQWVIKYVQVDSHTGEPVGDQLDAPPTPISMPHADARQVGVNLVYELVEKLGRFSENKELPEPYRNDSQRSLDRIRNRMNQT